LQTAALIVALFAGTVEAQALDKIHAGKSAGVAWAFVPLDVGIEAGIFEKYGLDVDITVFAGDQKMQLGLASSGIDFGLGGGPAMAFSAKGAPVTAVAAFFGSPKNISIVIRYDSPIKSVAELKGKPVSSSAIGSLTAWLLQRASIAEGWGPDGIKIVALGGFDAGLAALRTNQVEGMSSSVEGGLLLEEQKVGRNLTDMGKYAPVFITHVVFARRDLVKDNPDLVHRFLKGFFASIAYMKSHKAETSKVAISALRESPGVADRTWDWEISNFIADGVFDEKALDVLKQSFVEMGMMEKVPANDALFTTQFLPVRP
jgi:ABC-type nitrate/sulfonate/bicarbonate transport system substrate-binding protein